MVFLLVDGDDVGGRLERHLLQNNVAAFVATSNAIDFAIRSLVLVAEEIDGVRAISIGGDSVLFEAAEESVEALSAALASSQNVGGFSFSVGVGPSLRECYLGLRMAKTSGKGKIVRFSEDGGACQG